MSERKGQGRDRERSLPSFGFAKDLLAEDPQRIYAFADGLEAAHRAEPDEPQGPPPQIEPWITFGLTQETYALPVAPVQEVLRVTTITRVPHAPRPIRGVTQLRGRVIPVIDLRQRLGLAEGEIDRASRILVVASRRRLLGLLVDRVFQVVHLDRNQAQEPPEDVVSIRSDFIAAVFHQEDDLILLLDVDRVLVMHDDGSEAR